MIENFKKLIYDFEMLFDKDWDYTCEMMYIDRRELPNEEETFLTDWWSDWGYRDGLIEHYNNLKKILTKKAVDEKKFLEEAKLFFYYLEEVLEKDWQWTCWALGIDDEKPTFLNPQVEDETEDWGYRGSFLMNYRSCKFELEHL